MIEQKDEGVSQQERSRLQEQKINRQPTIFMMDLWATVPYYTAYLAKALLTHGAALQVGSITYYLDTDCFSSRDIPLDPGLMNVVGRFALPPLPRRALKLVEALINLAALALRFAFSPPDIVHVQYLAMLRWRLPLDLWFILFCRRRGSKLVLTVHDLLPHDTADRYKQTYAHLYRQVDAIICHSEHVRMRLVQEFGIVAKDIYVIPHGPFFFDMAGADATQTKQMLKIAPEQLLVLWQGIIFPYKGLDLLLSAWQKVESQAAGATLVVVGTGSPALLEQYREQARQLALERVVLTLRFVSPQELVDFYRAADVVVYPYRAITTSGALATGLALGKTIVASDLPVFRELLTNGENALLVDATDAEALSRALLAVLSDAALRERLAAKVSLMGFGEHSWSVIASETAGVYREVFAGTPAVAGTNG